MSWERDDYDETSVCACGQGKVIKHSYQESDDWNRFRSGVNGYDIDCAYCKDHYHIGSITRHYLCPSWKGDGIEHHEYLVPNGMDLPKVITPEHIQTYTLDADIASKFDKNTLNNVITDMKNSKYSTRVTLDDSKTIVNIFYKRQGVKALNKIIPVLQDVIDKYEKYKWNPVTVAQYKEQEQQKIKTNEEEIKRVLSQSFELKFNR